MVPGLFITAAPSLPAQVRELELNMDMKSVNNLLEFLEKVGRLSGLEAAGSQQPCTCNACNVCAAAKPSCASLQGWAPT